MSKKQSQKMKMIAKMKKIKRDLSKWQASKLLCTLPIINATTEV